jgi:hypothetical protein
MIMLIALEYSGEFAVFQEDDVEHVDRLAKRTIDGL